MKITKENLEKIILNFHFVPEILEDDVLYVGTYPNGDTYGTFYRTSKETGKIVGFLRIAEDEQHGYGWRIKHHEAFFSTYSPSGKVVVHA